MYIMRKREEIKYLCDTVSHSAVHIIDICQFNEIINKSQSVFDILFCIKKL